MSAAPSTSLPRLHVEREPCAAARTDAAPLALLHGWGLNLRVWDGVRRDLAAGRDVLAIDLPGHGRSDFDEAYGSLVAQAEALLAVLPPRSSLLGWSLGGQFALEIATRAPERVDRLILVSTTPRFVRAPDWPAGMAPEVLAGFATHLERDYRTTVTEFLELQVRGSRESDAVLQTLRSALLAHGSARAAALRTDLAILGTADARGALPALRQPVLVIAGQHDRVTPPAAGRALAAALPHAEYLEFPRAAHAPFLSHPAEFVACTRSFLSGPADEALDRRELARAFDRASRGYDAAAWLQAQVRAELLDRLQYAKLAPAVIVDLGAGTGHGTRELRRRYPRALVVATDIAPGMLAEARRRFGLFRRFERVCGDAYRLPFAGASVDLVFSSLMLQWCDDLDAVLGEIRRVLRPGGLFTFGTLGPDTLRELREAWAAADARPHVSRFLDMHDVGDALGRAGFAEPVLDVDRHVRGYADVRELMRELKMLGAHNASAARPRGLTGRGALAAMTAAYETRRREGRLPATFEVVYGMGWAASAPPTHARAGDGAVVVPLGRIGRRRGTAP